MEELTRTEERVMQLFWKLKKAFVKDIIEAMSDTPKPPYNTISSVVRLLEKKEYLGYKAYGKTYEYYPLVTKSEYRKASFKKMFTNYFDNSVESLLSFMVKEEKMNEEDIKKIKEMIDKNAQR